MATLQLQLGGRTITVVEDSSDVTIHADSADAAHEAAIRAQTELREARPVAPGMVRATVVGDRDAAMARLREDNVVHHLYRNARDPRQEIVITDSFHIKFRPNTPHSRIVQYLDEHHLVLEQDLGGGLLLVKVTSETGHNPIRAAEYAAQTSDVEYAEPNVVRQVQRFAAPAHVVADTMFDRQWHLHAPQAGQNLVAGAGIFAPEAWAVTMGSRDIVVAVADDGFDLSHPDFQGPGKVLGRLNLVPSGNTLAVDNNVAPRAGDYHGTPCAGVAIAEADGLGVVGVAPGCAFLPVRFPLGMSEHHFVLMFEQISRLADVVSCSWGYGPGDAPMGTALRQRLTELAQTGGRRGKGLVIVVAAGNNNCPIRDLDNQRPYQYLDRLGHVRSYAGPIDRWIAAHPDVITVSASTSLKQRAAYSSWGAEVAVCAPSDNWDDLRQAPTVGRGIVTTDNEGFGAGSDFSAGSRFTDRFGGTSSATPTVAGVCALVLSRNPALKAAEVKAIIQATADKDLVVQSATPVNVPGAFHDGVSPWFGHGKVNAGRAVQAALPAASSEVVRAENTTETTIPDHDVPVESAIDVAESGTIVDLRVSIAVRHTFVGDLRIDLVGPDGKSAVLHDHAGGGADDLRGTYSVANTPALAAFVGKPLVGRWRLRMVDTFKLDEGALESWSLAAKVTRGQVAPAVALARTTNGVQPGLVSLGPAPALGNETLSSQQIDSVRHDILLITPQDEYYRFPVNKTESETVFYSESPQRPSLLAAGTRKIRNLAAQGDDSDRGPLRGPVFATLPLAKEPAASSGLTCYLINTRNLEYRNPWTAEEWSQAPSPTRSAEKDAAFKLLVAAPDGKIYLLAKEPGSGMPVVTEAEKDNPEVWSQLRNGTVVGRTLYVDQSQTKDVVPLVNITSLTPSPKGGQTPLS